MNPHSYVKTIYDHPEEIRSHNIVVDGYHTHYVEAGDPKYEPLVLVHGSSSNIGVGADRWYPNIIPLGYDFHVFALDELGHGNTDAPRDMEQLGLPLVRANHAVSFIEDIDVGPVHLVGQSQGAWIAAYIALSRPDLVSKLVLIDSASLSGAEHTEAGLPYHEKLFRPGTRVPALDLRTRDGIRAYIGAFCYDVDVISEQHLDRLVVLSEKWNDLYMEHIQRFWADRGFEKAVEQHAVNGVQLGEMLGDLVSPTLVIWGKQSAKGLDKGVELYKRIPEAQMHILDKASHFLFLDQPEKFNSLVAWYLKEGWADPL